MSLDEDLRKIPVLCEEVTVHGREFVVSGKSLRDKGALMARCRRKDGTINGDLFDHTLLAECVKRKHDCKEFSADYWADVPTHITSPLLASVIGLLGFDDDDIKRVRRDPKDLSAIEN
jgi:hypothetical protein